MRIFSVVFLFFFYCSLFAQEKAVVISNASIFDGAQMLENASIVFKDGKVLEIGEKIGKYPKAKRIDGTGKTILPPLLNAHVHVWFASNLKSALKAGVFGMLDMHGSDEYCNKMREWRDSLEYAYYYSSNAGATVPGGHGTQFGIPVPTIDSTTTARDFTLARIENNADYIKILKEPMFATVTAKQTNEVIKTAHEENKLAVAHVSKVADAVELSYQGVDGFVHIWHDKPLKEEYLTQMKEQGLFVVPTVLVTLKLLDFVREQEWEGTFMTEEELFAEIKRLHEMGTPILAGTDAPNLGINYEEDLYEEMILLGKAGLSNLEVLKTASSNIYKAFQLKEFSNIAKGANASFILLDGSPLENLDALKNSKMIWRKGQLIKE